MTDKERLEEMDKRISNMKRKSGMPVNVLTWDGWKELTVLFKEDYKYLREQAERVQELEISGENYWYNNYQEQIDVSIWQINKLQELEEENLILKATRAGNEEYINMLLQQNKRYREAIEKAKYTSSHRVGDSTIIKIYSILDKALEGDDDE